MSTTDFYVSPFRLLGVDSLSGDSGLADKKDLTKAKKRLLAELELSETQTLRVGANEFNKNDVLRFFDSVQDTDNLEYHQAIYQDSALLGFLENGKLGARERFAQNPLYQSTDFARFLSPYFAKSLGVLFGESLQARDHATCRNAFENAEKMHPYMLEDAYLGVLQQLTKRKAKLQSVYQYIKSNGSVADYKQELLDACNFYFICMLNALPFYFHSFRDDYGRNLLNIAAELWNGDINKQLGRSITHSLVDLNCGDEIGQIIRSNSAMMSQSVTREDTEDGGIPIGRIVFIIIIIIKILLALAH